MRVHARKRTPQQAYALLQLLCDTDRRIHNVAMTQEDQGPVKGALTIINPIDPVALSRNVKLMPATEMIPVP